MDYLSENPHPTLGFLLAAMTLSQHVGAFFRPGPESKYKWIFSFLHTVLGYSTWIVALLCIVTAGTLGETDYMPSAKYFNTLLAFVLGMYVNQ